MTTCSATTAVGQPCKNHAMPGSQFCKAHGGRTLTPGDVIAHGAPYDEWVRVNMLYFTAVRTIAEADRLICNGRIHTGLARSIISATYYPLNEPPGEYYDPLEDLPDW